MSVALFLSLVAAALVTTNAAAVARDNSRKTSTPRVRVDPRVELVSVIFQLAGNPEYHQGRVPEYTRDVDGTGRTPAELELPVDVELEPFHRLSQS
jgi:hypothetical protein